MDIGIDLGTTFSVIAVKGRVEMAPGYPPGQYLEHADVTILPTPMGDFTFPSVLWWHPDEPDKYVVGIEAKQMAEEGRCPILFSKRNIGTDEKLMLNGRAFTAREVATHFLRYLKKCAEDALGKTVNRAVVTHPAYFTPNKVEETRLAAIDAGLNVTPQQMMMEPCAAALAYTQSDNRDPLRVMTYDLGGGTFDVAVMEKRLGVITMKKFDGDHLLGGYNFDRALVKWVLDQLKAQGRVIPYDETNEDHRGRRSRMLQVAEAVKIRLTEQRTAKVAVPVKVDFLEDDQGKPVQFLGRITREEYAALIKDELEETLKCCRRALGAANMTSAELDAVLLVGGSTYGQWVQDAVAGEFGQQVEPYHPDLCVAAGAAMFAAQLPPEAKKGARIELAIDVKSSSPLPDTNISGTVRPSQGSDLDAAACRRLQVLLLTPSGTTLGPAEIGVEGSFIFKKVSLQDEGEPSAFTISVSETGQKIESSSFAITYTPEGGGETPINPVLPRPLYLKTAKGAVPVAEEGKTLPAKCEVRLKKVFGDSSLTIPVLLGDEEVGNIQIDDIPEEAGEGSLIIVSVEVTQHNEMRGTVQIKGRTGVVVKEGPVRVAFPPIPIPDLSALKGRFEELKEKWEQNVVLEQDPTVRLRLAGPGKLLVTKIEKKLSEQAPDRQELNDAVKAFDKLINAPPDDMRPPQSEFLGMLGYCRQMVDSKPDDPGVKACIPVLDRIENEGKNAFTTKNEKKWSQANETLQRTAQRLYTIVTGPRIESEEEVATTLVQKAKALTRIEKLRASLGTARRGCEGRADFGSRWSPRCEKVERMINAMEKVIEKIADETPPKQCAALIEQAELSTGKINKNIENITKVIDVEPT